MTEQGPAFQISPHNHVFLGNDHERAERRTWTVIILCTIMMIAEIVGGVLFGSLALIADGLHMSTHAGALLLARSPTPLPADMPKIPLHIRDRQVRRSGGLFQRHRAGDDRAPDRL